LGTNSAPQNAPSNLQRRKPSSKQRLLESQSSENLRTLNYYLDYNFRYFNEHQKTRRDFERLTRKIIFPKDHQLRA
jgi:hypothetical protein